MAKTQAECNVDDPREMFAWMFAAGVPDPRGSGKFPNQPLIPPVCYGAFSEMLYKMGARFHPELQELWVRDEKATHGAFQCAETTDVKPKDIEKLVVDMAVDQYPDMAARIAAATARGDEARRELLDQVTRDLMANLRKINEAAEKAR